MNKIRNILINKWFLLSIPFCLEIHSAVCQVTLSKNAADSNQYVILTPPPVPQPRINGPLVYGCRPGHPFLYRIPCQGERPVTFSARGLPRGLTLNPVTGIITGITPAKGEYKVEFTARNKFGTDKRKFKIIAGNKLALTPPMGWNDWYAYYGRVSDKKVRKAAEAMIQSGMADVGYQYINIDDCWANAPKLSGKSSTRGGPVRDQYGNILPNKDFPDMNALTNYIHSLGLKAGIYSSPGPLTCAGYEGSYKHEDQDARQFARWGFDFLKYDWCSYGGVAVAGKKKLTLQDYQKPYRLMGNILKSQNHDIVFNLCQYGMADVWKWGAEVGGNCWRTAGDLGLHLNHIFAVALKNSTHYQHSKPGEWNDPDYIQIGWIGNAYKEGEPEPTSMPANMQYAYMSLWCLMAAPLIYSGDMSKLDKFTLNVLCNPEVIAVDQDPLGKEGRVIMQPDSCFLMVKDLVEGSKAVGLFNRGQEPAKVTVDWKELHIKGRQHVRDLWRQKNLGDYRNQYSAIVPPRGVVLIRIGKKE